MAVLIGLCCGAGLWYVHSTRTAAESPSITKIAAGLTVNGRAQKSAVPVADAIHAPLLAAAHAGRRIVAVGEHGVVLLSDDAGQTFRQAQTVPTQALLTSLCFVDEKEGWAAGHDGVVIHTVDGGDTWVLQHEDLEGDKPLFSIFFKDAQHGLAVGLFGIAIQTADGGKNWAPLAIETGAGADAQDGDHHLYAIFGDAAPNLYVAGETGLIYRSVDGGTSWSTIKTSNPGSFWAGRQLKDGTLLAAGQRGHLFGSRDQGASWTEIPSGTDQSLTAIVQAADGAVLVTGLAGTTLSSTDGGKSFSTQTRNDRAPLNAALSQQAATAPVLFGDKGVVDRPKSQDQGEVP